LLKNRTILKKIANIYIFIINLQGFEIFVINEIIHYQLFLVFIMFRPKIGLHKNKIIKKLGKLILGFLEFIFILIIKILFVILRITIIHKTWQIINKMFTMKRTSN